MLEALETYAGDSNHAALHYGLFARKEAPPLSRRYPFIRINTAAQMPSGYFEDVTARESDGRPMDVYMSLAVARKEGHLSDCMVIRRLAFPARPLDINCPGIRQHERVIRRLLYNDSGGGFRHVDRETEP